MPNGEGGGGVIVPIIDIDFLKRVFEGSQTLGNPARNARERAESFIRKQLLAAGVPRSEIAGLSFRLEAGEGIGVPGAEGSGVPGGVEFITEFLPQIARDVILRQAGRGISEGRINKILVAAQLGRFALGLDLEAAADKFIEERVASGGPGTGGFGRQGSVPINNPDFFFRLFVQPAIFAIQAAGGNIEGNVFTGAPAEQPSGFQFPNVENIFPLAPILPVLQALPGGQPPIPGTQPPVPPSRIEEIIANIANPTIQLLCAAGIIPARLCGFGRPDPGDVNIVFRTGTGIGPPGPVGPVGPGAVPPAGGITVPQIMSPVSGFTGGTEGGGLNLGSLFNVARDIFRGGGNGRGGGLNLFGLGEGETDVITLPGGASFGGMAAAGGGTGLVACGAPTTGFRVGRATSMRKQNHLQCDPSTGRAEWFGPLGKPVLWAGDFAALKRVDRVGKRAAKALRMNRGTARRGRR